MTHALNPAPEPPTPDPKRGRPEPHSTPTLGAGSNRNPQVLPFTESTLRTLFADQDDAGRHEMHVDAQPLEVLGGLAPDELAELEMHGDRVTFVFSLILGQFGARRRVGGLPSEPPVYSRILQVLSDGMLGYQQSKKLEDTPFPFPYAQLLAFMLYTFALIFPLLAASGRWEATL